MGIEEGRKTKNEILHCRCFLASENISNDEMQNIANEFHFSETTFIFPKEKKEGSYRVRIFTPNNEVPFAGHPTLGTAYIIRNELEENTVSEILLDLNVGRIPVVFDDVEETQWMKQVEPIFSSKHDPKDITRLVVNTGLLII